MLPAADAFKKSRRVDDSGIVEFLSRYHVSQATVDYFPRPARQYLSRLRLRFGRFLGLLETLNHCRIVRGRPGV